MSASASTPPTPRRIGTVPGPWSGTGPGVLASTLASAAIGTMATYWFAIPSGTPTSRSAANWRESSAAAAPPRCSPSGSCGPAGIDWTPVAVLLLAMAALSLGCVLSRRRSTRRDGGTDSLLSTPSMVEA